MQRARHTLRSIPLLFVLSMVPFQAGAAVGGPDPFGYKFVDSGEPAGPEFGFVDLQDSGTDLYLTDDDYGWVPIGFDFPFYGQVFQQVAVHANGGLSFDNAELEYDNGCLPYPTERPLIAVHWDDLDPTSGGAVYHATIGIPPDRVFIAHWRDVPGFGSTGGFDFEVLLFEASGEILLLYTDVISSSGLDHGQSATVGIHGAEGGLLEYSCLEPRLSDGLAILFYRCTDTDGECDDDDDTDDDDDGDDDDGGPPSEDDDADDPGDQDEDGVWSNDDAFPIGACVCRLDSGSGRTRGLQLLPLAGLLVLAVLLGRRA